PDVLSGWEKRFGDRLLPVQERAIVQHGLFEGRNLVVVSPTSSGKTFVGELAAVRAACERRRSLFLVPSKALADEKYRAFADAYGPLGIRVVCSTRDWRRDDGRILRGQFDILVGTTEKVRSLVSAASALLSRLGLLVVDELQLIADVERGPCLEVLVALVRANVPGCQIVCLSSVLGEERSVADWLGAEWLRVRRRPVELRRGVLCDGTFRYVEHNSGAQGEEDWGSFLSGEPSEQLAGLVAHLADAGEQTLVVLPTRAATERLARRLVELGTWAVPDALLDGLDGFEETASCQCLRELAPHGVAVHNAGMSWGERAFIEQAFREGDLMVVCATSTLGTGVNLPAKNVVMDSVRWHTPPGRADGAFVPITKAEFENVGGRAGRLHQCDDFGRAILLAESEFRRDAYMRQYVAGDLEPVSPALASVGDLLDPLLQLVAASASRSAASARALLSHTLAGRLAWSTPSGGEELDRLLRSAVRDCVRWGLLSDADASAGDSLTLTAMGRIDTAHGVPGADFAWLREWADRASERGASDLAALLIVATTPYVRRLPYVVCRAAEPGRDCRSTLLAHIGREGSVASDLATALLSNDASHVAELRVAAGRVLALNLWLGPEPTEEVERLAGAPAGSLMALAEACSWLLRCLADIGDQSGWSTDAVARLRTLSLRLPLGAPEEGVSLAHLRCPGFGRDVLRRLLRHGIAAPSDIARVDPRTVATVLPRSAIAHLGLHSDTAHDSPTDAPSLAFRAADPDHILVDGRPVRVRPAELRLARLLARHAGDCVPYGVICERLWGEGGEVYQKQVFVHKSRLLRQLCSALPKPVVDALIVAVPGKGLRMNLPSDRVSFA
ncbi:MAG: DEAD/DEAH box helicase, partial [Armatimonadota bacterium]